MEHLGNFRRQLLWLAVTLAVVGGCSEPVAPKQDGPLGTSSAALTFSWPVLIDGWPSTLPANPGSTPSGLVAVSATTVYFAAQEESSGRELWRSDGTEPGTQLIKDLRPGPDSSAPSDFTVMGGLVYFTADDGSNGRELWRTNGTAEGTVLVSDINPGQDSSNPGNLKVLGGFLYFSATHPLMGTELWRTNGFAQGTQLVRDIVPGSVSSAPQNLTVAGTQLFFTASTTAGREVWKSDGTPSGTVLVRDLFPGSRNGFISELMSVGSTVYFVGYESSARLSLWTTDGTSAGTRLVYDPTPGDPLDGATVESLTAMNGRLYFVSMGRNGIGAHVGYELWTSDGTSASLVKDVYEGSSSSWPKELVAVGNVLYFRASEGGDISELWKSNGTSTGTVRVSTLGVNLKGTKPEKLTAVGGVLFYTAEESGTGRELWRSDGTFDGTRRVRDLRPGTTGSNPEALTAVGNRVFFSADNGTYGMELWTSDGTDFNTYLAEDIHVATAGSDPRALTAFDYVLYYTADSEDFGREPRAFSGSFGSPDLNPGTWSSSPSQFVPMNGALLFDADNGINGRELWTSDVATGETRLLKDLRPGNYLSSSPHDLSVLGGRLYFIADDGQTGFEPWTSDGTPEGTRLLKDLWVAGASGNSMGSGFVGFNGGVYFRASNGSGSALYRTDGTTEGTVSVTNVVPYFDNAFAATPGFFFFPGFGPGSTNDIELWKSDGTAAGTQLVKNIGSGVSSWPDDFVLMDGVLYFSAAQSGTRRELWRSDGTEAGTWPVMQLAVGTKGFNPRHLTVANRVLFFQAYDLEGGTELWRSDGTTEGTRRVRDLHRGPVGSMADQPMLALEPEGLVVFAASDADLGMEPFVSDGTEAGTRPIGELALGPFSSNPRLFTRQGEYVFFVANDRASGFELWRTTMSGAPDTTPPTLTCPASMSAEAQSASGAQVSYPAATVSDDTPGRPAITYSHASGTVFPFGATSITATATDAYGNTASCAFTVTVQDTTAPGVSCPASVTVDATSSTGAVVSYPAATVSDASATQVTYSHASGTLFPPGTTAVTVTATDAGGRTGSCSFNVTVRDTTAPEVSCPANVTAEATSASGATVSYPPATASDAMSPPVTVGYSHASGTVFPLGVTVVTATATDAAGNSSTCSFSVTVRDTTAPEVTCPANVTAEANSASGATVSYAPATVHDLVTASPDVTYSRASGTVFPLGTATVTVTARDAAGNAASCSFDVSVQDTTKPEVNCPASVTAEATSAEGAAVSYPSASASDTVTASPVLTYSHTSGTVFPLGVTTVTATATDEAGNAASCSFEVTVRDATRPEVTCPASVTAEATSASGAAVSYPAATASDTASPPVTLGYSQGSGTVFPLGVTTVTVTATDAAGNVASCSFDVTVQDTTAPALTCPANVIAEATNSTGATVSYASTSTSDAVTASPALTYSHASGALFPIGATTLTATATDAAGNSASCTFDVTVQDTTAPALTCPVDTGAEATSASGATLEYAPASASDAASASPDLVYSHASGTVFPLGATQVAVTARDASGNETTCHFTLTVRDTTAPSVGCTADLTVEADGADGATVPYELASPLDTVTRAPQVSSSHATGSRFPLGTTTVTVTARDEADNAASCTFSVTVQDTTPPALSCPADMTVETRDGADVAATFTATASDAVTSSPMLVYSHASGSLFPRGTTPVTVTARDEAGLTAECTFQVTVRKLISVPAPEKAALGCSSSAGTPGGGSVWLLLLGSAVWFQRRSRARVH
ncbi:ELWxxDGT repeat protein [Pyxidicoccus trucidator]|uniref:ELWxxDGT repeat protein n=1 Tax=Pyxidicoccus trucidator TaxID=2709662 RepID=UPI0013DC250B|nr:ELWxxDGT repeat protein [Pyxidicoccus trucidator]